MPLALEVGVTVFVVLALIGAAAYCIDKSAARHERSAAEGRRAAEEGGAAEERRAAEGRRQS